MRRRIKKKRGLLRDREYEKLRKAMEEGWKEEAELLERLADAAELTILEQRNDKL